jgi:hypothetical protein
MSYPDGDLSYTCSVALCKYLNSYSDDAITTSLDVLSISLFTAHPTVACDII